MIIQSPLAGNEINRTSNVVLRKPECLGIFSEELRKMDGSDGFVDGLIVPWGEGNGNSCGYSSREEWNSDLTSSHIEILSRKLVRLDQFGRELFPRKFDHLSQVINIRQVRRVLTRGDWYTEHEIIDLSS